MLMTPEHEELRHTVAKFVASEINPHVEEWEAAEQFPSHEVFAKLGKLGLLGIKYDPAHGGLGLDFSYSMVMAEELGACDCGGVPMAIGVHTDMCTPALNRFGSEELKKQFLAPSIAGETVGCLAVSEPGGGSDVAAVKTTARKDGGDYVISGTKMWITNGMKADWCCLLANTSDGKPHQNKSLICVPMDAKGISRAKIRKIGMNSSDTAQLFFDEVRVPQKNRIGQEGMGFTMQMLQFQEERLWGAMNSPQDARPPDRPDHRICARPPGLRQGGARQPGRSLQAGRIAHRGRGAAGADLERGRTLRLRQGRDQARLDGEAEMRPARAARLPTNACNTGAAWATPGTIRSAARFAMAGWCRSAAAPTKSCSASSASSKALCPARPIASGRTEMKLPAYETLLAEFSDGVLRLTLNRPQAGNAMTTEWSANCATRLPWRKFRRKPEL